MSSSDCTSDENQLSASIAAILNEIATSENEPTHSGSRVNSVNYRLIYKCLSCIFTNEDVKLLGHCEMTVLRSIIDRIFEWANRDAVRNAANAILSTADVCNAGNGDGWSQSAAENEADPAELEQMWKKASFNTLGLTVEQTLVNCVAVQYAVDSVPEGGGVNADAVAHSVGKLHRLRAELKRPAECEQQEPLAVRKRLDTEEPETWPEAAERVASSREERATMRIEIVHVQPAAPPSQFADNVIAERHPGGPRSAVPLAVRDVSTQTKVSFWRLVCDQKRVSV